MNTTGQSHTYLFFLGSHSDLSRLEVEAVLTARGLSPTIKETTDEYLLVEVAAILDAQLQDILGGSDRFAIMVGTFPALPAAADIGPLLPSSSKKIAVGLSGLGVEIKHLARIGNDLKDWCQQRDQKMRFVLPSNQTTRLNAAAVMSYRLDEEPNSEFTFVRLANGSVGVARTIAVQDIRSYELRDTKRPTRDATIGLLPPKLAQIMINLSLTPTPSDSPSGRGRTILDPFCGMGTILQEGWLADYKMVGSDTSERMVRASEKNLAWLQKNFKVSPALAPRVFVHQADTKWSKTWHGSFDAVVTEPFLGKPVKAPLQGKEVTRRMNELGTLYRQVFKAVRPVLKQGGVVVFALPAWRVARYEEEWHLFPEAFLDALEKLGYSKHQLGSSPRGTEVYARPDALVGRELTVWKKN